MFENVVCEMLLILSRPQCVNSLRARDAFKLVCSSVNCVIIDSGNDSLPLHYLNQCFSAGFLFVPHCVKNSIFHPRIFCSWYFWFCHLLSVATCCVCQAKAHINHLSQNTTLTCIQIRCDMAFIEPMHRNKPNITYLCIQIVCISFKVVEWMDIEYTNEFCK